MFGAQELVPAADMVFTKAEELATSSRSTTPALDPAGKPNLTLEYNFHRRKAEAEKFFNKTNPQTMNASKLPPTFDPAKFPVPGGIEVPLRVLRRGRVPARDQDHRQGQRTRP